MHPVDSQQHIDEQAGAAASVAEGEGVRGVSFEIVKAVGRNRFYKDPEGRWWPKKNNPDEWLAAVGK